MKNKYLYIGGIVILGALALIYSAKSDMPSAHVTVRALGVQGFPLRVMVNDEKQIPNDKNVVEVEKQGENLKLGITALEDTNIQLIFDKRTQNAVNGKCGESIAYTSALVNDEEILSERALQSVEPALYTISAKQGEWFEVSTSWDKAAAESDCVAYYTFNSPIEDIEITGLSDVENWGRWSDGNVAEFNFTNLPQQNLTIAFSARPFLGGEKVEQNVAILANDELLTNWHFAKGQSAPDTTLNIFADKIKDGKLKLTFKFEDPMGPKDLGLSNDSRKLGIGFKSMTIKTQN